MKVTFDDSGTILLCRTIFVLLDHEESPEVEVVFRAHRPEDLSAFLPGKVPYVFVGPLSVTRTDTRQPIELTTERMALVVENMVSEAAGYFAADDFIGMGEDA